MKKNFKAVLLLSMALNLCHAGPATAAPIAATEVSKFELPIPENSVLERQLCDEFEYAFWHSNSSAASMRKLFDYYKLSGHEDKFDKHIERLLGRRQGWCGTTRIRWAQMALSCCCDLKRNNELELLSKCLPYAAPLLEIPEYQDLEVLQLSKLAASGTFGYYDGNDLLKVGCGSNECIKAVSQFRRPLSLRIFPTESKVDLAPLKGMSNIQEFTLSPEHSEAIALLPTFSGLKALSTTSNLLQKVDLVTLAKIKDLELYGQSNIGSVDGIWEKLPRLKKLSIQCDRLTETSLASIARSLHLESLKIFCFGRQNLDIKDVCKISSLSTLIVNIEGLSRLPELQNLNKLENLDLHGTAIGDSELSKLAGLSGLKTLNLSATKVCKDLSALTSLKNLSKLELSDCHLSTSGMKTLSGFHSLEDLDLSNTNIKASQISYLCNLPKLRSLTFDPGSEDVDAWLTRLSKITSLREITFQSNQAPVRLEVFSHSTSLERFRINHHYANGEEKILTDVHVANLSELPNLKHLEVHSDNLNGSAFKSGFQGLEELDLTLCPVTDDSIASIAKLPALRKLKINGKLLTGRSINLLSAQANLDELMIYDLQFTDKSIDDLQKLRGIPSLTLGCTKLSLEGLHSLKKHLPTSSIIPDPDGLEKLLAAELSRA